MHDAYGFQAPEVAGMLETSPLVVTDHRAREAVGAFLAGVPANGRLERFRGIAIGAARA